VNPIPSHRDHLHNVLQLQHKPTLPKWNRHSVLPRILFNSFVPFRLGAGYNLENAEFVHPAFKGGI
jgi:hypothetical protein